MKKSLLKIAMVCVVAFINLQATAQDILKMTPADYKEFIQKADGIFYYDNLGVTMAIAQEGNISSQLKNGASSDRAVYDNIQICHRLYRDCSCIPQYVVEYTLQHFDGYLNYYTNTLSKTGNVSNAAAEFILLTGFHGKCKAVNKSYDKFVALCDNFNEDDANDIVADNGKNNGYRGATLLLLTAQLLNRISASTVGDLPDKTRKNLVKTYTGVVKECEKALKKDNPQYNQYVSYYKETFEKVLDQIK